MKQTETISIEWKSASKGKPEKFYDTISSLIGGTIIFGVEEVKNKNKTHFDVAGVYDVNDLHKHITNICNESFEPVIRPEISIVNIDEKNIVAVRIEALNANKKPCYYKPKGLHNGSYIRVGDSDDNMTEYEIYKCISYRDNVEDDLRAVVKATIEDLDHNLLDEFIDKYTKNKPNFSKYSRENILLKAGVITKMERADLPEPVFKNEREDFCVTFYNGEYPELRSIYTDLIKIILENKTITQQEMADKLGKSRNAISRNIKTLKELNIIERLGSNKDGYWKVNL